MERRNLKFMLALSPTERTALQRLAENERLSAAAVVRRLIWEKANRCGLLPADDQQVEAQAGEVRRDDG